MNGMMMDFPLTLPVLMRRAEQYVGHKEIVTRRPDRSIQRMTYAELMSRAKRLALALQALGLQGRVQRADLSDPAHGEYTTEARARRRHASQALALPTAAATELEGASDGHGQGRSGDGHRR